MSDAENNIQSKMSADPMHIQWTEDLKRTYCYHVQTKKAYIKAKGDKRTIDEKHQEVINLMFSLNLFPGKCIDNIKPESCRKAFNRWLKEVTDKAGIEKEGANLS